MNTFIMIIVLMGYSGNSTAHTPTQITAEFNSPSTCEYAREFLAKTIHNAPGIRVISTGCFKK